MNVCVGFADIQVAGSEAKYFGMVGPARLELATLCLEGRCSIHLSYGPKPLKRNQLTVSPGNRGTGDCGDFCGYSVRNSAFQSQDRLAPRRMWEYRRNMAALT